MPNFLPLPLFSPNEILGNLPQQETRSSQSYNTMDDWVLNYVNKSLGKWWTLFAITQAQTFTAKQQSHENSPKTVTVKQIIKYLRINYLSPKYLQIAFVL